MNNLNPNFLLSQIEREGKIENNREIIINGGLSIILDLSGGRKKIRSSKSELFSLALTLPEELKDKNPFEIRCFSCGKVISYPAWVGNLKLDRSEFFFFLCFFGDEKVKIKC